MIIVRESESFLAVIRHAFANKGAVPPRRGAAEARAGVYIVINKIVINFRKFYVDILGTTIVPLS